MVNFMFNPRLGGSPSGTSSRNTSSYSCNTLKTTLDKVEDKSLVKRKFSLYRSTKNVALGSLNYLKSPFLAIITNPFFPLSWFFVAARFYLALETLPHYFYGSLASGSRSLVVFFLDHPSKFPPMSKGAKKFALLCT